MTDRELMELIYEDVSGLKEDMSGVKEDISSLKEDVSGLKEDVSSLKEDMSDVKAKLLEHDEKFDHITRMLVKYDDHEARIKDLESKVG